MPTVLCSLLNFAVIFWSPGQVVSEVKETLTRVDLESAVAQEVTFKCFKWFYPILCSKLVKISYLTSAYNSPAINGNECGVFWGGILKAEM